jgi:hypothetical protein
MNTKKQSFLSKILTGSVIIGAITLFTAGSLIGAGWAASIGRTYEANILLLCGFLGILATLYLGKLL